ncbi:MAG: phosphoglycerate kinase [Clostridiales bacterium]|jgi:phosphoglycerate kinase|nr:phosphoglycerate kinase [Clostridiales bacterium]HOK81696.1 phosphoglycerate kinase [Clostridia bacterium]HOL60593.1 phosphoglycerate kinase [Clostridia bacterium]HPO53000.1 phosphoglycerate kinase [Clostridia bacterium]
MEGIKNIIGVDVRGKRVLFRPDINSPVDKEGNIVNDNRLVQTAPTVKYLLDGGAKLAIIAHQGDTLDYQNLMPLAAHAKRLSELSGYNIEYIDDVCGDAAVQKVKELKEGEAVLLGNLRYLTEEVSTFEKDVKLTAEEMKSTWLVRRLAPLFDIYVNEAFSAAHRNAPSMVCFQKLMPSYAGPLFFREYEALYKVMHGAQRPVTFVLGGAKISDAFGMMDKVLAEGSADHILACGVTGIIMLIAKGKKIGKAYEKWLADRDLMVFVKQAEELLAKFGDRYILPVDFACEKDGKRIEVSADEFPIDDAMFLDIGHKTVEIFRDYIKKAGTVFVNGPAGVYENPLFEYGTREIWRAFTETKAYTVIGGGDTVSAASRFIDLGKVGYVCTAGGAMVRFLSGKKLPLIEAFKN